MNKVGERIQDELEKMQENQAWLAAELKCSRAHVSDMISGRRLPSVAMIHRIEEALDIDGLELLVEVSNIKMDLLIDELKEERRDESVRR